MLSRKLRDKGTMLVDYRTTFQATPSVANLSDGNHVTLLSLPEGRKSKRLFPRNLEASPKISWTGPPFLWEFSLKDS